MLEIYRRPYDSAAPVICMDEQPSQLIKETRKALGVEPGKPQRVDYEYERNGTAVNFMFTEPLGGWPKVSVRERKTAMDWAYEIRDLLDGDYPEAEKVIVVCDNLNTHTVASFCAAFEPKQARQLVERLEIHYTPKHGSWLNMAEIEMGVLSRRCLSDYMPTKGQMIRQVAAWEPKRNQADATVECQFTTADARVKLKRLHPVI